MATCNNCGEFADCERRNRELLYCPYCGTKYGSPRKFYRQVFEIEVLIEGEPLQSPNLEEIRYQITEGHCSGVVEETVCREVTSREMASLLWAQGSDPGFFMLDEDGNDIKENGD